MTAHEHAKHIRNTLKRLEAAMREHHKALQQALEELGPGAGISGPDIGVLGGGTNKTE
ncbi:MAG TPA: hypothetical protein VKB96_11055 [Gammaproteobacteria bacterium]|nr:hypothetical protein [Gammaproteobacteria bacterium]